MDINIFHIALAGPFVVCAMKGFALLRARAPKRIYQTVVAVTLAMSLRLVWSAARELLSAGAPPSVVALVLMLSLGLAIAVLIALQPRRERAAAGPRPWDLCAAAKRTAGAAK